jgi:TPR repeat protein
MPIPEALRRLIHDPAFWSDYKIEEIYENSYASLADFPIDPNGSRPVIPLVFPLSPRRQLRLRLSPYLDSVALELLDTEENSCAKLAFDSWEGPGWCLRWEEVDLFGRCLALQDPDWWHPGPLVLFLERMAPVTTDQDVALAFPLREAAWQSLGLFSPARIRVLMLGDQRTSDLLWRFEAPHGWRIGKRKKLDPGFPFSRWNQFVKDVEERTSSLINPERLVRGRPTVERHALALAETARWDTAPALADALEEAGCRQAAVLAALRSGVPVRVLWVLELLLGEPHGRLIRRHLGSPARPPEAVTQRLEVQLPDMQDIHRQVVLELQKALFEQGRGTTYFVGGISWPLCQAIPETHAQDAFTTELIGDAVQGLDAIRRVLANHGPPAGTAIFSWTERRHLSLIPGSGLAPDPRGIGHEPAGRPPEAEPVVFDLAVQAVQARLATRPLWLRSTTGRFLTWIEYGSGDQQAGGRQAMTWEPQTEEEMETARRFWEAGNWRSYTDLRALYDQPRRPGDHVVRSGLGRLAVPRDPAAAMLWFEQAARHGDARAQASLGFCNAGGDFTGAFHWHARAAEQGDALAQWTLGNMHHSGLGVEVNDVEAARWLRRAPDAGLAEAHHDLGFLYQLGLGVPQDDDESLRWYGRARELGDPLAAGAIKDLQYWVGTKHEHGIQVLKDLREAVRWYRLAADQGHAGARDALARLASLREVGRDRAD